ncbi:MULTISPECIES: PBP1A family penicillin-binding protein [unclassified Coleofasciculus]|uniref:PBP1A family penicillin-binding protein n=1 Tax=unclassified Coleofasciculus TaxID=2692782 RepID=UPI00187F262D|nr:MULTISPECIES: PBP1A family penicillin-binding protein [unclassified Coleofasciculus]MBE9124833.1 PBP1A family penicillin-binding protein [Coleofasciculus sp. LEGE 07081]MBE9147738.1 PBP1A family penicillin-binding protein [Coleofasciculus sp. LEGE 07092]
MSSPQPPQPPKTLLGQLTQAVQTIQAKVNFQALALKPNAKVPELWVQDAGANKADVYPLLGDRYLLGRSSKSSDIVVRNPVVSQIHLSLERYGRSGRAFLIKDENSTNGIYRGKRRLSSLVLRHGDILTIGPPELAASVRLQYVDPPPWYILALRYSLYGVGGVTAFIALLIGIEWLKVPVYPLPTGVQGPFVVKSRDGTALRQPRTEVHRELKQLSDFSPYLPNALIASEDSRYYWHFGVDPYGIARAFVRNIQGGTIREGASTITQQVARSLFPEYVGRDNSAARKLREAVVALKLETLYSKDEILKAYLNRIYLGVEAFGFEDAAQFYFDKPAKDLTLSEAATLAAILPAPNSYNPIQDYDTALQLRNRVIYRMRALGMISDQEAARARRSRIEVSPQAREFLNSTKAPYFYNYVFEELRYLLGTELAQEGNFIVETSLDLQTQAKAESALRNFVNTTGSQLRFSQGAIATLDTSNGAIRAMVGGVDYQQSQFNRATQAQRQPGSTFKLFDYTAALQQGISPGKTYSCAPAYGLRGCERTGGAANMYTGLAQSENIIAVRVAQDAGLNNVIEVARRLGIDSKLRAVPRLAIGQSEVNVLEITGSYGAIANNGVWNRPHAISRILDSGDCADNNDPNTCRVIYTFEEDGEQNIQAVSPAVAKTMTTMLRGVVQGGTGRGAAIGYGEAGKTGTTDRNVDLWFIGYIPARQVVTGIWLGNDDNSPTRGSSGQAAQLWSQYMREIVQ